mmetsp:Transcript_21863/g.53418  ORF Transcript_21863/g.53418 Transcript_21863/m.53418 type:complete len:320 (-) Transcript_21863:6-965(-)
MTRPSPLTANANTDSCCSVWTPHYVPTYWKRCFLRGATYYLGTTVHTAALLPRSCVRRWMHHCFHHGDVTNSRSSHRRHRLRRRRCRHRASSSSSQKRNSGCSSSSNSNSSSSGGKMAAARLGVSWWTQTTRPYTIGGCAKRTKSQAPLREHAWPLKITSMATTAASNNNCDSSANAPSIAARRPWWCRCCTGGEQTLAPRLRLPSTTHSPCRNACSSCANFAPTVALCSRNRPQHRHSSTSRLTCYHRMAGSSCSSSRRSSSSSNNPSSSNGRQPRRTTTTRALTVDAEHGGHRRTCTDGNSNAISSRCRTVNVCIFL